MGEGGETTTVKYYFNLKNELRSQLQNAWAIGGSGLQEVLRPEATCAGREPTTARRAALIATQRTPLGVVEDIERFRAELEGDVLSNDEVFKHCHVDVPMARVAQKASARTAEG